jgi:hypothetical protein
MRATVRSRFCGTLADAVQLSAVPDNVSMSGKVCGATVASGSKISYYGSRHSSIDPSVEAQPSRMVHRVSAGLILTLESVDFSEFRLPHAK